jgi:hypothetical protein
MISEIAQKCDPIIQVTEFQLRLLALVSNYFGVFSDIYLFTNQYINERITPNFVDAP